jgi:hypothetical protein
MAYDGRLRFERRHRGGGFPVELVIDNDCKGADLSEGNKHWPLTPKELERLRDEIDELLNPQPAVVQVTVIGHGEALWSYEDPSGELRVDDLVRVPFGFNDTSKVGIVRKLGRGPFKGGLKSVLAKFTAEEL